MNILLIIVLLVVNIPVYKKIKEMLFPNPDDFSEAIRYAFTPDLLSLFRGEYWNDRIHEAALSFMFLGCIIVVAFEYFLIRVVLNIIF